jgi:putative spermidine/putrescine transport system ATP-binding protein
MSEPAFLTLSGLEKTFGKTRVVQGFSLQASQGEFISLLGPSGCGKTTVLRMIAGFEQPTAGSIRIGDLDVTGKPANQRQIGMVFQSYALFPNMTVARNIGFGLKVAGRPRQDIDTRVAEMLELIDLPELGHRYPSELSGGQQQRVSLARALAREPKILLLDEPLSALDAKIRVALRDDLRMLQRKLGITAIFVTHDQEEALALSDRVVVMNAGKVDQIGSPADIYSRPATPFVATFVGALNVLQCDVVDAAAGHLKLHDQELRMAGPASGATLRVGVRPEAMTLTELTGGNRLTGTVEDMTFLGPILRLLAKVGDTSLRLDLFGAARSSPPRIGDTVTIWFAPDSVVPLG